MNSETSWVTLRSLSLSHFTFSFSFSTWRPVPPFPHLLIHAHLNIYNHIYDKTHLSLESNQHIQRTHLYFSSIVEKSVSTMFVFLSTPTTHSTNSHPHTSTPRQPFFYTPKVYLQNFTLFKYTQNVSPKFYCVDLCVCWGGCTWQMTNEILLQRTYA